jgi:hypothetical protein
MPKLVKKTRKPKVVSGDGYCRKCQKSKALSNFYEATNPMLDANGFLSVCKDCCADLYSHYFTIYNNVEIALKYTCRDLDVCFNQEALRQTQSHIENLISKGKKADAVFGYYKSKLGSTGKNNAGIDSFRYKDSDDLTLFEEVEDKGDIDDELVLFWGRGFTFDDYVFLEKELSNWKRTHKCDNQAEITLLKEICVKVLEIRKTREEGKSVGGLLKELQDLMKTASVDPAKANIASAGKSLDTFGIWVKEIEQFTPAEWHDQQEKYKDMDGFIPYIQNYIVRPIRNFITGNRDFQVNDNIDAQLVDDVNEDVDNG